MAGFFLRPRAVADLDGIWDFTVERWGEKQAKRYVDGIRDAIARLAANPKLGRPYGEARDGYFKIATGSHVVIYRIVDGRIGVERILHQAMDIKSHL